MIDPVDGQPPWPHMTINQAVAKLGVPADLLRSLAAGRQIRAQWTKTSRGNAIWLLSRDDVQALAEKMRAQR